MSRRMGIPSSTLSIIGCNGFTNQSFPSLDPIDIRDMSVTINGTTISGSNVSVVNGVTYVDGNVLDLSSTAAAGDSAGKARVLEIVIHGNVSQKISTTSGNVTVNGSANNISTMSGDVCVNDGNVAGGVSTMSGDVTSHGAIGGTVTTMSGSITSTKAAARRH